MATNADIWRERNGTARRIAQGVASGYTPSDVQSDDRFYVLPPGERPVGPGAPKPLLQNLQLFADFENWTAGDPLPNRYPDNSGVQYLTDNNTVQEETASPLVGNKSGSYGSSNDKYHRSSIGVGVGGVDVYLSCFFRLDANASTNNPHYLIAPRQISNNFYGFHLGVNNGNIRTVVKNSSLYETISGASITTETDYFLEGWWTASNQTLHLRLDNGTELTKNIAASLSPIDVGVSIGHLAPSVGTLGAYGEIDQAALEIAPQGALQWPSESTWLYNGGAGRSWDEIKTYTP